MTIKIVYQSVMRLAHIFVSGSLTIRCIILFLANWLIKEKCAVHAKCYLYSPNFENWYFIGSNISVASYREKKKIQTSSHTVLITTL